MLAVVALAASAQNGGLLQGRVVSSLHGEPMPNVLVTLRELEPAAGQPQVYICQSGADGRFSLAGVAPGLYDLLPSKQGYETHALPPITVEAGKTLEGLELRLTPESVIAGRVLDADGDPVRYAQVEAQQYSYASGKKELRTVRAAQTNDRGEYRIFYLPPGRYYLRADPTQRSLRQTVLQGNGRRVSGALPLTAVAAYYPGVADAPHATELQAQPGGELDGIDFSLKLSQEKLYTIRGKLPALDPGKTRRAIRLVERTENDRRPQYSIFNTNDSYEIRNVTAGSYVVSGDATNAANPDERQYARQQVEVIDHDVDGVDLVFSPGVRVTGTVKVAGSSPVQTESLKIFLQPVGSQAREQTNVGADGKFASVEIAPGSYQFVFAGRNAYLKTVRVGEQEAPGGIVDTERLSGPLTVMVCADFGRVEGTVTDQAGKPVYRAYVTLIPDQSLSDGPDRFENTYTTAAGTFHFSDVRPGDYRVFAWLGAEPGAPAIADFRKPYEDRGTAVKVEVNGRQSLDLKPIVVAPER
jgi:hypothetical protein